MTDLIPFNDFKKLDLRVGKVVKVEDHPNADKLYVLSVDFGPEIGRRTIVAGLKQHCSKQHLEGKSAIFIVNLEPAQLRGVESQGMILAAINHTQKDDDSPQVCIVEPEEELAPGSKVE